jgi:hypothetical protein
MELNWREKRGGELGVHQRVLARPRAADFRSSPNEQTQFGPLRTSDQGPHWVTSRHADEFVGTVKVTL